MTRRGAAYLLGALLAFAPGLAPAAGSPPRPRLAPVVLPRDHGAHPSFVAEWWYTAGTVSAGPRNYFWFATVWSGGPMGAIARLNVVDLRRDRIVLSKQYLTATPLRSGQHAFAVGAFRLSWRSGGARGRWSIDARTPAGRLALSLDPSSPYVLNGPGGIIHQGPGALSAYYSEPRLASRGELDLGGRRIAVHGLGWLDHQWGNFGTDPNALRWDWFACQFADGRDLMLYQFLDARDQPTAVRAGTFIAAHGVVRHPTRFTVQPLAPFMRPARSPISYPLRWRLRVPGAGLDIVIRARARHQFIRNTLLPSFWEGAAAIARGGSGGCIVESTRAVGAGL